MKNGRISVSKVIILSVVCLITGFFIWASTYSKASENSKLYLSSHSNVNVEVVENFINPGINLSRLYFFSPDKNDSKTCLIIYPGGKVDPKAYSTLAFKIADMGIETVIVPMPFNLAIFGIERAKKVIEGRPDIENWFIAGHSLGGIAAAYFSKSHPDMIDGLILWATYTGKNIDISNIDLPVLSVYGELDGLSTPEKIMDGRSYLPENTLYYEIKGGNHSGFGDYGIQNGDNEAKISPIDQHSEIVNRTVGFIENIISSR
jgi:hypothetical protein